MASLVSRLCDTCVLQAAEIEPEFSGFRAFSMCWEVLERVTGIEPV